MISSALQVVFIDWHLTLSKSVFWEHLAAADSERYELLRKSLFMTLRQHHAAWMRGAWTSEQIMTLVSHDTQLDFDFVFAEFVRSCQSMQFIDPTVPSLVAELRRRGLRVIIATDNMDSFSRFTAPAMGLPGLFDDILNSFDLKALKEDFDAGGRSLFFDHYLLAHGLAPERCVLIDDSRARPEMAERMSMGYRLVTTETPLVRHLCTLLGNY
jgi:FMN phosphatase YigB (HAD superfamily)